MALIDTAYSYYMTTYGSNVTSRYDTHKKSELRSVYNNIIKVNKEAPLSIIKDADEAHRFAIDIKEASKDIQRVISSMSSDASMGRAFRQKVAVSSNPEIVQAEYIGEPGSEEELTKEFDLRVEELAGPQVNRGNFLRNDARSLAPGEYAFDVDTNKSSYEFQFTVRAEDDNFSILNRLSNLMNRSNLGLKSEVLPGENSTSALQITSEQTGLMESEDFLFRIYSDNTYNSNVAMDILGIGEVTKAANNSTFFLNEEEHHSYSNTFMINKTFEVTLNSTGVEGDFATIGFKADADAIADSISHLTAAYNKMVTVAREHTGESVQMNKLYNVISNMSAHYKDALEPMGLLMNEDSTITVDRALLSEATEQGNWDENFAKLYDFKQSVASLASKTSLNPMEYVNKTVVAYKNPGHTLAAPYASSTYAGMLYDFAC